MFNKKKKEEEPVVDQNKTEEVAENTDQVTTDDAASNANEKEVESAQELSTEEKLQQENTALNDKYLRLFAEFDNYKRRTQKERVELLQTAGKDVVVSLLPVLDDFERAIKATENTTDIDSLREGILLVQQKLKGILTQRGLKEISSKDAAFDTDLHEAITQVPAPTEELKGKVIDEVQKGYTLNDKVIRYAKVVVGA
ncbi:nucleotide exchange factor GrpE [Pedobacter sp.]|uniref:nucleotide exchange factor GrpE n=1 Tax=Pedobacter sp. TaxID=1411316 RepID=UPI00396CE2E8